MEQREEALRQAVFCEGGFRKGEDHCKETGGQAVPDPGGQYYPRQFLQASDEMYNGKARCAVQGITNISEDSMRKTNSTI